MSNHNGNANKMVGTPRTDAVQYELLDQDTYTSWLETTQFARQLERELNAANAKIKRLEEAGDAFTDYFKPEDIDLRFEILVENWHKAKESKP